MQKQKLVRADLTPEAFAALERIKEKVCADNSPRKLTRSSLLSSLVLRSEAKIDRLIPLIQEDHNDPVSYVEGLLRQMKQAKRSGTAQLDLWTALEKSSKLRALRAEKPTRLPDTGDC